MCGENQFFASLDPYKVVSCRAVRETYRRKANKLGDTSSEKFCLGFRRGRCNVF